VTGWRRLTIVTVEQFECTQISLSTDDKGNLGYSIGGLATKTNSRKESIPRWLLRLAGALLHLR
jgi:hypothetical protein